MKILDRYIARHFVGPFVVGVGAFAAITTGVSEIYWAVQLVVRDGIPAGIAVEAFLLHIPQIIALTMPMSAVFAALMTSAELSGHGEITAMRAGGMGVVRMACPVLVAGLAVSVVAFAFNEALGPRSNAKAARLIADCLAQREDVERYVTLRIPEHGAPQRLLYADKLSAQRRELTNVTIIEFDNGKPANVFFADRASWRANQWVLERFVHKQYTGRGYREWTGAARVYDLGRTPEQIQASRERRPETMSLRELREEAQLIAASQRITPGSRSRALWLLQHYHFRLATPWAALCFALLGFPLGLRPQRTGTGVGFGVSLAVVFVYYIMMNSLRAFGEQGALSPVLAAWCPNAVILCVGLGLMLNAAH